MADGPPPTDHRRAAAARSIEAILDAAERLLAAGADASLSAVAAAAGVSRVTLYAHFPTRGDLLEAVAERVVARHSAAVQAATLDDGPPDAALDRLIETGWRTLDQNLSLLAGARGELSNEALLRAHQQIDGPILALIGRGRRERTFRTDVPARWLLATYYALMHACADEVNAGRLTVAAAVPALKSTIQRAFAAQW